MMDQGRQTKQFFNIATDNYGNNSYRLKSLEQYSKEHNAQEQPSKKYFTATTLPDIINQYPIVRKMKPAEQEKGRFGLLPGEKEALTGSFQK
jgi:dual specificity protein kinase YAK1